MSRERRISAHRVLLKVANSEPLTEDECDLLVTLTAKDRERALEDAQASRRLYGEIITDGKLALMLLGQYDLDEDVMLDHALQVMSPEDGADLKALMGDIAANQHITNLLYGAEWSNRV